MNDFLIFFMSKSGLKLKTFKNFSCLPLKIGVIFLRMNNYYAKIQ